MNRDQWALFYAMESGWPMVGLLANYDRGREQIVAGAGGRSGIELPDGRKVWGDTDSKGLHAWGFATDPVDDVPRRVEILTLKWSEIKEWASSQPESVHDEARAFTAAWGSICRDRDQFNVGYTPLGPSWANKTQYGPKTQIVQNAIDCDARERELRAAERAFVASLAPTDEPMDLLELLEMPA